MVTERIDIDEERLTDFCMRWRVNELALFGSALREDFGPESDLDILVTFESGSEWGLLDHVNMEQQFLLGCKVDMLTRRAVENSPNWILRREILNTAEVIYGAG